MNKTIASPGYIRRRLSASPGFSKILANIGWLTIGKLLQMMVGVLVGVWVARYLGPAEFGQISYALAFVGLVAPLASMGVDSLAVRDLVREPEEKDEILGTIFVLKLFGGCLVLPIVFILVTFFPPEQPLTRWLVLIVATGMVFQSFNVIDLWFQSQVSSKATVITNISVLFLSTVIKVGLILTEAPLIAFALAGLAEIILGSLGLVAAYRIHRKYIVRWRMRRSRAVQLLSEGWPLILSSFTISIYMRIDQVMLGNMLGEQSVGVYASALKVSEAWYFVPLILTQSVSPAIIKARGISEELYYQRLQQLFTLLAAISYSIAITMTFLSDEFMTLLYGQMYASAGSILAIHIWTGVFVSLGVVRNLWVINEGHTRFSFYATAVGALVNVGLNLILIPKYAGVGAAIATVLSQCTAALLTTPLVQQGQKIFGLQLRALCLLR